MIVLIDPAEMAVGTTVADTGIRSGFAVSDSLDVVQAVVEADTGNQMVNIDPEFVASEMVYLKVALGVDNNPGIA